MTTETHKTEARVHHATAAKADKLAAMLAAEYPAISLWPVENEDASQVTGWVTNWADPEDGGNVFQLTNTNKVPELADVLAACEDQDLDPEAGAEDEDDKPTSSVVDEIYRTQYRELSSTRQSCGDWLAEWLADETLTAKKALLLDDYVAILSNNGVDLTAKWALVLNTKTPGWQGRFRMNGRQQLEKRVALTGKCLDATGTEAEIDPQWLATQRVKHAKWLAKQEKAAAAVDAIAEEMAAE